MPKRVAVSTLNASTIDILNVIRANASQEYQDQVPKITKASEVRQIGDVLYGYPALQNQFVSALVNRIASVRAKSATFNNPYSDLKKGFLEFGETVEEIFVQIAKVRVFSYDKAEQRELKRSMPDVRSAFHTMNWNVQYPVTITESDLQKAFLSMEGVQDLITRIVDTIYQAANYDEYLLFKYLMIKGITKGSMYPVSIDDTDMKNSAIAFRSMSNQLTFMNDKYNNAGVQTVTPKEDQVIFMDATYNARYDVEVLAAAFNMSKTEFMGKLYLIDDFTTFDNKRFNEIRLESDMIDEVTEDELTLMKGVKAVIADKEWFQVYDNMARFTEKFVASGDYWNYFYRVQKTISYSPFSNAVVFADSSATVTAPGSVTLTVQDVSKNNGVTVVTLIEKATNGLAGGTVNHVQTEQATKDGVAVHRYGAYIIPDDKTVTIEIVGNTGEKYTATEPISKDTTPGTDVTCNKAGVMAMKTTRKAKA